MKKQKKNNKGIITLPFLLVLIIILFFALTFLMLSLTLSHVTISQYLTYSSARKLSLAGEEKDQQLDSAISHYEKLRGEFFKPTAHTGKPGDWFSIQNKPVKNEQEADLQGEYNMLINPQRKNPFYGINSRFTALTLNLKIPFLIEDDKSEINKLIRVSSFLGREPSKKECEKFHDDKLTEIAKLCDQKDCPDIKKPVRSIGDNGC